jgi:hypothetical protein
MAGVIFGVVGGAHPQFPKVPNTAQVNVAAEQQSPMPQLVS